MALPKRSSATRPSPPRNSSASGNSEPIQQAAQTAWGAIRAGRIGRPRVAYAELDDDFLPAAPWRSWRSESGAPWPAADEFRTGCTLEHAGYHLGPLMAMFGPVRRIVSGSGSGWPTW